VDAEHVIVLPGAQCAVYSVAQCLLDPGDEVIVAEPMYVTYEGCSARAATVVPVPVRPENGFRVDPPMSPRGSRREPARCCSTVPITLPARALPC
jgi:aspartate/methionine/tyrosine aminotransferase